MGDSNEDCPSTSISTQIQTDNDNLPTHDVDAAQVACRSHDPSTSLKRSDPFQFGSRFLEEEDDVFEFNAWDHVVPDAEYEDFAERQFDQQRKNPVSSFDKIRFINEPEKWWNRFYTNNTTNFFKNRKWLQQEFPILSKLILPDAGPARILEVGAGAGNTAFPILAANQNAQLMIHACDFSSKAVDLIRKHEQYQPSNISADVWDIASETLPHGVEPASVDVVLLVFIFSALTPAQWVAAVRNVWTVLKPGGEVCFRDYGRGDLTQVRFKKGRLLDENFYIRGDGTRVYFFTTEELQSIWSGQLQARSYTDQENSGLESEKEIDPAFEILSLAADRRMLVNRRKQLKMYRCWLQGRFRKPNSVADS